MNRTKHTGGPHLMGFLRPVRGEGGAVIILMAVVIVALFAFAVVAIDGSILQTTKTQLQNGADAAALAGALEYALTESEAAAKAKAVEYAGYN